MKRYGNLWDQISSLENILVASDKAVAGKRMTKQRADFILRKEYLAQELHEILVSETYKFNELHSFTIYEPKVRKIHCSKFYPDRVLHHCLMNVIAPILIEKFTHDTYSSIPGKGVSLLASKVRGVLKRNPKAYFLQVDIKKFYESIDIGVVKRMIRRSIKCLKTLRMIDAILEVHDKGIPIGSYPSQYFANLVLSSVDHWVKEVAREKHYFRYMDDMLFIVENKQHAHDLLSNLVPEITKIKLEIKNNVRISPVRLGIDFVGYKFFPTHTLLRKRIKMNMQRRVRRLIRQNANDVEFKRATASHFGWCSHADCRNLLRTSFKHKMYLYGKNTKIPELDIRNVPVFES